MKIKLVSTLTIVDEYIKSQVKKMALSYVFRYPGEACLYDSFNTIFGKDLHQEDDRIIIADLSELTPDELI